MIARAVGALVLSVAQLLATVFVTVAAWLVLPPPLGAVLTFLMMVCLVAQADWRWATAMLQKAIPPRMRRSK